MPLQNIEQIESIFQVTELSMDPRNYLGGFFKSLGIAPIKAELSVQKLA